LITIGTVSIIIIIPSSRNICSRVKQNREQVEFAGIYIVFSRSEKHYNNKRVTTLISLGESFGSLDLSPIPEREHCCKDAGDHFGRRTRLGSFTGKLQSANYASSSSGYELL